MRLITQYRKWFLSLGIAIVVSAVVTGIWLGVMRPGADWDPESVQVLSVRNRYSSLDELSTKADVVVIGTVNNIAAEGVDRGPGEEGLPIPYTIYELDVTEVLKGDVEEVIYVLRYPPGFWKGELVTELSEGQTVALYLREVSNELAPTIIYPKFYNPLTFDNGVFDIAAGVLGPVGTVDDDAVVVPRGIGVKQFPEGSLFKMSELREAIEPDSDEVGPVGSAN